jgi:hypothetical protein
MDKAAEECAAGVLRPVGQSLWAACRSLGEGGHASSLRSRVGYYGGVGSAGSAEDQKGTTAVRPSQPKLLRRSRLKPWGSTHVGMSNMACLGVCAVRVSNLFYVFSFAEYLVASTGYWAKEHQCRSIERSFPSFTAVSFRSPLNRIRFTPPTPSDRSPSQPSEFVSLAE